MPAHFTSSDINLRVEVVMQVGEPESLGWVLKCQIMGLKHRQDVLVGGPLLRFFMHSLDELSSLEAFQGAKRGG